MSKNLLKESASQRFKKWVEQMDSTNYTYPFMSAYGIEIEYMLVDRNTLRILPISDQILADISNDSSNNTEFKGVDFSNEIVLHLLEIKTKGAEADFLKIINDFNASIQKVSNSLLKYNAQFLPTGMHPFMNPDLDTHLWPYQNREIYSEYHRIFNCRKHGWANIQGIHINLPFTSDAEFGQLHAAIRLVLPIIPLICSSSPIMDGIYSGYYDTRLKMQLQNFNIMPAISGKAIPERVFTKEDYLERVYKPITNIIFPEDPDDVFHFEWLNARAVIPRFSRHAIEIKNLDTQECVSQDIAVCAFIIALLKHLLSEKWQSLSKQQSFSSNELRFIYEETIKLGEYATIFNKDYLSQFGLDRESISGQDFLAHIYTELLKDYDSEPFWKPAIHCILNKGTLATRIKQRLGNNFNTNSILEVYQDLAKCLYADRIFI